MSFNYNNFAIIIPAFNEEANIQKVITAVKNVISDAKIIVINDGSTDRSAEMAKQAGAVVLNHPFNLGYGAALQTGFKFALMKGYDAVVQIDGDGQHDPSCIPDLIQTLTDNKGDVVLGSRFISNETYKISYIRKIGMRIFSFLASVIMKQPVTDTTSGYQALNKNVLQFYADRRYPVDFPDADVLIMLKRSGFRIKEIPVKMYGSPKSMHSGLKPIYYIFKMFLSIFLSILRREKIKKEV
jgi:glycosyltransferase involved in cell wall biosynthesis